MANSLNFQQPPRIPSALTSRNTFNTSLSSGHVTPTTGMFPTTNNSSYVNQQSQQQQLSPNRNVQLQMSAVGGSGSVVGPPLMNSSARSSIFGGTAAGQQQQRAFADRRAMSGLGGGGPMVIINRVTSSSLFESLQNQSQSISLFQSNIRNFMPSREYGSQSGSISNFHNVFASNSNDTGTPPLLDLSEFPSLTNARGGHNDQSSLPQVNTLQPPGSKPYGKIALLSLPLWQFN